MAGAKVHVPKINLRELAAQVRGLITRRVAGLTSSPMTADELVDLGVVGANATGIKYSNGDITGSSDNGDFKRFANLTLIVTKSNTAITTSPIAFVGTITKLDGDKMWIGVWK